MSRIKNAFVNGKAFIAFVTGGDPTLDMTQKLILTMQEAGADLIEIGIPFSDPVAEGPVIQEANERALAAGCTTDRLFDALEEIKDQVRVPLVFLTYINPIFTYGKEAFMKRCKKAGIDGLIVPDLPYEERAEIAGTCDEFGVDLITMVAPTSRERIAMVAAGAKGFVYCVSSLGVTGVRSAITTDIGEIVAAVREATDAPCAVGFGIAEPKQAKAMAALSDGAIVGSAIVKLVAEYGGDCLKPVSDYVRRMKAAVAEA